MPDAPKDRAAGCVVAPAEPTPETAEATNVRLRLQVRIDDLEAALESILSWRPTLFAAADRAPGLVDFLAAMDGAARVLNARPHRPER